MPLWPWHGSPFQQFAAKCAAEKEELVRIWRHDLVLQPPDDLRAEILIREENYGARSEGFDLDNFQRELELFCMESHAGQPCADLIK